MATRTQTEDKIEPTRVFEWAGEDGQSLRLVIPKRIKRGKMARRLGQNDMIGALDVVFTEQEIEAFEDLDLSPEEWDDLQTKLFEAIAGLDPKSS
ncbi:hypothetical protein [Nonomuraea gerenzanensis]|uniref:Uncharacterized protein n=1 Tax=Nonomuraea gerenzanensis TaxID=93944 RepID=A0A1M4EML2_9ACTN|nr:hypothetical protein [Nonomuraea gerenzanensis]UBU11600.1 hypothetical protein LCN96_46060 [Nonomuraea gerenzanensis]SBP00096.1 hypothetical protein BN4615_P9612 [Nonomuraea gerenzanensis]